MISERDCPQCAAARAHARRHGAGDDQAAQTVCRLHAAVNSAAAWEPTFNNPRTALTAIAPGPAGLVGTTVGGDVITLVGDGMFAANKGCQLHPCTYAAPDDCGQWGGRGLGALFFDPESGAFELLKDPGLAAKIACRVALSAPAARDVAANNAAYAAQRLVELPAGSAPAYDWDGHWRFAPSPGMAMDTNTLGGGRAGLEGRDALKPFAQRARCPGCDASPQCRPVDCPACAGFCPAREGEGHGHDNCLNYAPPNCAACEDEEPGCSPGCLNFAP